MVCSRAKFTFTFYIIFRENGQILIPAIDTILYSVWYFNKNEIFSNLW
jgi:hypothetical protein